MQWNRLCSPVRRRRTRRFAPEQTCVLGIRSTWLRKSAVSSALSSPRFPRPIRTVDCRRSRGWLSFTDSDTLQLRFVLAAYGLTVLRTADRDEHTHAN